MWCATSSCTSSAGDQNGLPPTDPADLEIGIDEAKSPRGILKKGKHASVHGAPGGLDLQVASKARARSSDWPSSADDDGAADVHRSNAACGQGAHAHGTYEDSTDIETGPSPSEDEFLGDLIETTVDFRVEMWQSRLHTLKVDMLQSVWNRKVEWALRTGTAILLSGIYSVLPVVQYAEWNTATVFAPVLAIAGVAGPSVGDTLHHCWHFITGAILGSTLGCVLNEAARTLHGEVWKHWMTFALLNLGNFFLLTRPGAPLGQRRVSTCVLVIAVYKFHGSGYSLEWWFPFTIVTPILVACLCAIIAVLLPWPCKALSDWHRRAEFQALATRAVIAEQYDSAANCSVASITAAAQLMEVLVQNLTRMQSLKSALEVELLFNGPRLANLMRVNAFLQGQLNELRSIQSTLNDLSNSESYMAFRRITNEPWQAFFKAVAAATDEAVNTEGNVSEILIKDVEVASAALDRSCEQARKQILYSRGTTLRSLSLIPGGDTLPLEHCQRMAMHFFAARLANTFDYLKGAEQKTKSNCCRWLVKTLAVAAMSACSEDSSGERKRSVICEWFACPSGDTAKGGIKKALTLAIISFFAFVPDLRAHFPEFVWAAIAACFIFSDSTGSSVATGLHRISGTLFGGVFGLIALDILGTWRPGYVIALVVWTLGCALFRSSPTHGYLATVSAFSAPIMMIGALEAERQDKGEWIVLHRTKMQAIGAAIYVLVENVLWPASARETVTKSQAEVLDVLRLGLAEALEPYSQFVAAHPKQHADAGEDQPSEASATGLSIVGRCKSLLQPATEEPLFWRNPFPRYAYEQVLWQETRAFRAVAALHDAVRAANTAEVPQDACKLISSYAQAADSCLKSAFAEISAPAAARALGLAQSASLRSAASIVAPLLELTRQSQKFQIGMTQYLFHLTDEDSNEDAHGIPQISRMHSQTLAFSVQTIFFCCLEFNKIVLELSDKLRAVSSVENAALHI
eukprot:TRINITY_DN25789_c0_g1_i1.p1 TRINITY_DN25789_c0_g1~~TRINITY_DN25789_c0_g1_i1.p1  ORF type:complete len:973 (+),score=152.75 TRINITY_DN25789_c0_g1_i1:88-3006(+)